MVLRIGVNLGDILVDESDIHGDGVNVASRLEALAEPGTILVSAAVREQVERSLAIAFDDMGEQSLKNLSRPIRVYRLRNRGKSASADVAHVLALPNKPSIAVLPFDNMSGDPEQQYFSDGITEDIITELSRYRSLFVIARHSSFQYRGKAEDAKQIGRALGVAYLVEGSVRKAAGGVRVTAQLIESLTSNHLWAERFDRDLADVFAVQDEIVRTIVSMLVARVETQELELAARRAPSDMRAYDLWLRGKQCLDRWTGEANAEARRLFERAVEVDAGFARGYAGRTGIHVRARGSLLCLERGAI
jgi:adenylate cyclase